MPDIPYGYCGCGCGGKTLRAKCSNASRGHVKGEPLRFIHGHNSYVRQKPREHREEDRGYTTPCWIWQHGCDGHGYGVTSADERGPGGKRRRVSAHRVYYERAKGRIPAGHDLDHLCRVPACVNPEHLEAVPHIVNIQRGANAKLTREQAAEIREAYASGVPTAELAARYGVHKQTAWSAATGRTWGKAGQRSKAA